LKTCQEQNAHWGFNGNEHWIAIIVQNSSTRSPRFKLKEQACHSIQTDWPLNINL
jgi:hypothetical protein